MQSMQARWTLGHSRYITDNHTRHIQHVAIRVAASTMMPQYQDELERSIDRVLGNDHKTWKAINPAQAMDSILLQSSLRYIVGSPLCANEAFLRWSRIFIRIIFPTSEILRVVPSIMRPLIGHALSIPCWMVLRKLESILGPTFDERLRLLALQSEESFTGLPQDFLQQLMRSLYERNSPDLNIHFVTIQVLLFSVAATFSTSLLASHVFYDILASDPEYNTVAEIKAELKAVFRDRGPTRKQRWTRLEAEKLRKLDSILRECLRINNLSGQSMPRKVMTSGLRTPDGYEIPKGATVSLLARGPQMDADIYPDPHKFVPFRHLQLKKRLVDTGPEFLPFGHQSGSCPGRFLLAVELKMLVAYLVRHYELELPGGKRPEGTRFGEFLLPPLKGAIRVRRKEAL
ncbi:cytochrome P450 [Aspergillus mulundensis]|uniref:Putative Cytochrome P450 n=1 Tax=Aspergillus mulundensis TaxID=1810919 RepID=A0A3D8S5D6_9EURO|nr:putative Cytochrome P450 [Aspergillus mulundensis]RDW81311.1 putative Cytochrome P450 [Aspergillus mulundensis]